MIHNIQIAGRDYVVEFEYKVTTHGSSGSYEEPPEAAEWHIEGKVTLRPDGPDDNKELELELPEWFNDRLVEYLQENEEVNEKIQEEDANSSDYDPDYYRD